MSSAMPLPINYLQIDIIPTVIMQIYVMQLMGKHSFIGKFKPIK